MTDTQFQDLKQFIEATVSQALAHVATKDDLAALEQRLDQKMDKRFDEVDKRFNEVDKRFDEVITAIGDTMTANNDQISRLERHAGIK